MYKKFTIIFALGTFFLLITGCTSSVKKEDVSQTTNITNITIATIGVSPSIDSDKVKFETIQLKDLKSENAKLSEKFDAIFIMPEFFNEAAADKYISEYEMLKIPTFFIESKKDELPFINKDVSYETAPKINSGNFATGYLNKISTKKEFSYMTWKYQLSNNLDKKDAIELVYTQIFETISDLKSQVPNKN